MSKEITVKTFTEATQTVDDIHTQLEHLTPPEALEILRMVQANLKTEIRDSRERASAAILYPEEVSK